MKKLRIIIAFVFTLPVHAQIAHRAQAGSSFCITAGMNFPLMCYAAQDGNKATSGFARCGISVGISYTWYFSNHTGVKANWYYNRNSTGHSNDPRVTGQSVYRVTGLMTGPVWQQSIQSAGEWGFSPLVGISRVWTPALVKAGQPWLEAQTVTCFSWGADMFLQYPIHENNFFRLTAGHYNMKPKLPVHSTTTSKTEQHILGLNGTAGFGWNW
jgi:hypothetical protein